MRRVIAAVVRLFRAETAIEAIAPAPVTLITAPRVAIEDQFARLASIVLDARERTTAIASAQARAIEQLHAADYALDQLFDGLAGAMTIAPRRQPARVMALAPQPIDIRRRRLAA